MKLQCFVAWTRCHKKNWGGGIWPRPRWKSKYLWHQKLNTYCANKIIKWKLWFALNVEFCHRQRWEKKPQVFAYRYLPLHSGILDSVLVSLSNWKYWQFLRLKWHWRNSPSIRECACVSFIHCWCDSYSSSPVWYGCGRSSQFNSGLWLGIASPLILSPHFLSSSLWLVWL